MQAAAATLRGGGWAAAEVRTASRPWPNRAHPRRRIRPLATAAHDGDDDTAALPRFHVASLPPNAAPGSVVELEAGEARHARALRLGFGARVALCDGRGGLAAGILGRLGKDSADVVLDDAVAAVAAPWQGPRWRLAVACATLKGGRADWLVEKATVQYPFVFSPKLLFVSVVKTLSFGTITQELGAYSLTPLLTERSPDIGSRLDRWERLASAATKQCLRVHGLNITEPVPLQSLLLQVETTPSIAAVAGGRPLAQIMDEWRVTRESSLFVKEGGLLIVGPEGDFTRAEKEALDEAGALAAGLGPLRLRVETAAIALLAAVTMAC
eukprot:jgi/Chlat1/3042/Chrsp208S03291